MSLSLFEGGVSRSLTVALCGPRCLCDPLITLLRRDSRMGDVAIIYRSESEQLLQLVAHRHDIATALLFWPDGDIEGLIDMVEKVRARQFDPLMSLLVRGEAALAVDQRERLHELGIHGFAHRCGVDDERVVDDIVSALQRMYEKQALVALAEFGSEGAGTRSLNELAAASLHFLHRHGIGRLEGGMFFLLRPTSVPTWITLGGTGQFGALACTEVAALDIPQREMIIAQLAAEQPAPDEQGVWLRMVTPEGAHVCLYLLQKEALRPWHRVVLQVFRQRLAVAVDEVLLKRRMDCMHQASITTLATLAEYRDVDTACHVSRVARLTAGVATLLAEAGVMANELPLMRHIGQASVLHDVGKVGIPDRILLKNGPLTPDERAVIQHHAEMGQEILIKTAKISDNPELMLLAADIARWHHEKFDGTGYPDGLAGDAIPLGARIVAVIDVFDALTGERPYKQPWPEEKALDFICAQSGKHFDPKVVEAFLTVVEEKRFGRVAAWDEAFSVGQDDLDQDHKTLFDILNEVGLAVRHGNRQVIEMALDDLIYYTMMHFKREEEYMLSLAYPHYESHRAVHQTFTEHIEALRWEYYYGVRDDIQGYLLNYLANWLTGHIGKSDRMYKVFLESREAVA
jgi:hemerythrin-like metal-binding protein